MCGHPEPSYLLPRLPVKIPFCRSRFPLSVVQFGVGPDKEMELAFRLTYSLANLNYIVNPFTYAWKNAPLKADMMDLWSRCRGRPPSSWNRRPSAAALPT